MLKSDRQGYVLENQHEPTSNQLNVLSPAFALHRVPARSESRDTILKHTRSPSLTLAFSAAVDGFQTGLRTRHQTEEGLLTPIASVKMLRGSPASISRAVLIVPGAASHS
jgi:hypothetical protein